MTKKEISISADRYINDVFGAMWKSTDKEVWRNALEALDRIMQKEEYACGEGKFIIKAVKYKMIDRFGKKFVKKKVK